MTQEDAWALPLPPAELLAWAWQRWEVEVMHRELKSGFGLGDQQQWHPRIAALVTQCVVWTYAMLVLAAQETWGTGPPPAASRWHRGRRWTPREAVSCVREELWRGHVGPMEAIPPVIPSTPAENPVETAGWPAWLRTLHAL